MVLFLIIIDSQSQSLSLFQFLKYSTSISLENIIQIRNRNSENILGVSFSNEIILPKNNINKEKIKIIEDYLYKQFINSDKTFSHSIEKIDNQINNNFWVSLIEMTNEDEIILKQFNTNKNIKKNLINCTQSNQLKQIETFVLNKFSAIKFRAFASEKDLLKQMNISNKFYHKLEQTCFHKSFKRVIQ